MRGLIPTARLFIKRNSSTILSVIGAGGVVATTVMAVKATPKAMRLLDEATKEKGEDLTLVEKVQVAGPAYIPAAAAGLGTIACIFGANTLNKRQQAALMSAYALLNETYSEYREKVVSTLGKESDAIVRKAIVQDKFEKTEVEAKDDKELFFDFVSMDYFESTMADALDSIEELNRRLGVNGYITANEYFGLMGMPFTEYGDRIGWSLDQSRMIEGLDHLEFEFANYHIDDGGDGLECTAIYPLIDPSEDFMR